MNEHVQAQFTNLLKETAIRYKDCDSLREALSRSATEFISSANKEFDELMLRHKLMQEHYKGLPREKRIKV